MLVMPRKIRWGRGERVRTGGRKSSWTSTTIRAGTKGVGEGAMVALEMRNRCLNAVGCSFFCGLTSLARDGGVLAEAIA